MIQLPKSKTLSDCPAVWQNYINSVNPHGELSDHEVIEITLREWRGICKGYKYVKFLSEEDELYFILRWSNSNVDN